MAVEDVVEVKTTSIEVIAPQDGPAEVIEVLAGEQGVPGPPPPLLDPTITTGAAGTQATVDIDGDNYVGYTLSFQIPRGDKGDKGDKGDTGPAPTLNAPVVTTAIPGSSAGATWTGSNPYTLNLTVPRGATILQGTTAPESGTGSQGDWFIDTATWDIYEKTSSTVWSLRGNIKGAKGDTGNTGATGPANTLSVGTVSASAPGSTPVVTIDGTAPIQTISFTLPRGDVGPVGPAPNLTAAATLLAAGSAPTAAISGTNPNYTLTLGIPKGDKGDIGAQWLTGASAPAGGTGVIGDFYLVTGVTGTGDVYKKTDSATWTLQGNIRGQAGTGNVNSINSVLPDGQGNVVLTWSNFSGTIPASALPSLATVETYTVASQAAMLALSAQRGDVAIRTDIEETFMLSGDDPAILGNWTQLLTDGSTVKLTGNQTIAGIKTFSSAPVVPDASFTIAKVNGLQGALDGKAATTHNHDAGAVTTGTFAIARIPTGTTSTTVALGNHLHTGVYEPLIANGTTAQYYRGDKQWATLNAAAVGLGNVANLAQVDLVNNQSIGGTKTFTSAPAVPDGSFTVSKISGLSAALDVRVGIGSWVMPNGVFTARRLYMPEFNNLLWIADKRYTVTGTLHNISDDALVTTLNSTQVAWLFDGNGDTYVTVPAGQYLKVVVNFGGAFPGYSYGDIISVAYSGKNFSSASTRVYTDYAPQAGWNDIATAIDSTDSGGLAWKATSTIYQAQQMEFKYNAASTEARLTEISFLGNRIHTNLNEVPYFNKHVPQTLYFPLSIKSSGATTLTLNTNGSIVSASTISATGATLSGLTASRVVTTGTGGLLEVSAVTTTELGYLSGVTSAVQTQLNGKQPTIAAGTTAQYYRGDKTWQTLNSAAVGLGNVSNAAQVTIAGTETITGAKTFSAATIFGSSITSGRGAFTANSTSTAAFGGGDAIETRNDTGYPAIVFHKAGAYAPQLRATGATSFQFVNQAGDATVNVGVNTLTAAAVTSTATTNSLNEQVFYFTTGNEARPTGTKYVRWIGPVTPVNAANDDTWVQVT